MDPRAFAPHFEDGSTVLVRTDFSDDGAWQTVVAAVTKEVPLDDDPEVTLEPHVVPLDDRAYEGRGAADFAASWDRDVHGYVLIADARTMTEAAAGGELSLVYVDLYVEAEDEAEFGWEFGRSFRCAVDEIAATEANLSLANMDFADFADNVGPDGVFRGFTA